MKRLLLMLVVATAALGIFVGAASASGTLSVDVSPTSASPGSTVTFTGTLAASYPDGSAYWEVFVNLYGNAECSGTPVVHDAGGSFVTHPGDGDYAIAFTLPADMPLGTVWVQATNWGSETTSGCVPLPIVTAPAHPVPQANGIFLCYSVYQDQPGVWPEAEAKALLAQGYWYPYAVSGKVAGGTTIGGYHLTCNIAATQSVSNSFMGGDGSVLGANYAGVFGFYPVVGT